jgi:8-amino-3,8-dideoxy-alpha-D-manno-octulosonate transaminase
MIGNCCDMDRILPIAEKHGLYVIEDCCQAAGASYRGKKAGSMGHFGCFSLNIFKTVTAGDGGMIITKDAELYERAFGIHDQGHEPNRTEVAIGDRSILGLNFRINELTGAVALAQVRKLDHILERLRSLKKQLKERLESIPDIEFRRLPDPVGECATLLGIILPDKRRADEIADRLETRTLDRSGWHVYSNMEHVLSYFRERGIEIGKGSFPHTDDILERTIILSIGVVDPGVGSGFGININSSAEEIEQTAERVHRAFAV